MVLQLLPDFLLRPNQRDQISFRTLTFCSPRVRTTLGLKFRFCKKFSSKKPRPKIELQSKHTKLDSKNNITSIFSSNKKLGVIGGAAAAIAIIVIVGFGATNQTDIDQSSLNLIANNTLLVSVDESNYEKADIISISGDALSNTKSVELSIENADGIKIWKEVLGTKNNGEFSTLLIAAGGGWENGGVYTLNVAQNDLTSKTQFKFSP